MKRLHGSYGAANLDLDAAKAALRKRLRAVRTRLADANRDAPADDTFTQFLRRGAGVPPAVLKDAGETPALRRKVVASYLPQGSEFDPQPIVEALTAEGWTACLPRAATRDGPLTFHVADGPLVPDAFGIPAPSATAERLEPDLLIVPVLAFDRAGGRLGQGAGCYDRAIAELRASREVRVIGLAYAGQEVPLVPCEPHDQRLDGILTDKGYLTVVERVA